MSILVSHQAFHPTFYIEIAPMVVIVLYIFM